MVTTLVVVAWLIGAYTSYSRGALLVALVFGCMFLYEMHSLMYKLTLPTVRDKIKMQLVLAMILLYGFVVGVGITSVLFIEYGDYTKVVSTQRANAITELSNKEVVWD